MLGVSRLPGSGVIRTGRLGLAPPVRPERPTQPTMEVYTILHRLKENKRRKLHFLSYAD